MAAWVALLFLAGMGVASPFFVPTGESWTLLVQALATLLIAVPAVAAIVWLNEHIPQRKQAQQRTD